MNIENNTFLLCFSAVIWRRIFICFKLYCEHNSAVFNTDNLLKSIKYNLLSPTGIVNNMKPFLIKSFKQGFLMPKEYRSNIYVSKAIRLFGNAYEICKIEDLKSRRLEEIDFIIKYCSDVFSEQNGKGKENKEEEIDCIKDVRSICNNLGKHCTFCELFDGWDIDLRLINNVDPYQQLITYSILKNFYLD